MSRPQEPPDSEWGRPPELGPAGAGGGDEDLARRIRIAVEDAGTPITVSKLAERLHGADDAIDDATEYGDLHEALYRDYLQALDAETDLVFDMELGLVYPSDSTAEEFGGG
ncbi:hypothetical protein [Halorussus ruber]|uniref:hypothetical protein n=1 Tax=Halorussus ruber TaxID=1126238 RepID=UPI0010920E34|nr:hypothetical protein [Halorussus ruber]